MECLNESNSVACSFNARVPNNYCGIRRLGACVRAVYFRRNNSLAYFLVTWLAKNYRGLVRMGVRIQCV